MRSPGILVGLLVLAAGCWNYRDQLERADAHYHGHRYEAALTNLEDLEPALGQLDASDRARFAFVCGMSHARLGQRADARHWLATAREMLEHGATLRDEERDVLQRTLAEVDWGPAAQNATGGSDAGTAAPSGTEPIDTTPASTPAARRPQE